MKGGGWTLALAAIAMASSSASAYAADGGGVPMQKSTAKEGGGPTTNALPGCGEGGGEPTFPGPPPPVKSAFASSPGGVDMRSGSYSFENEDVAIGSGGDGLSLKRSFSFDGWSGNVRQRFGKFFSHNWDIQLRQKRTPATGACYPSQWNYNTTVSFGALGEGFLSRYSPVSFQQTAAKAGYAELTTGGGPGPYFAYTFTAYDGTRIVFQPLTTNSWCPDWGDQCAYAQSVTRPDGTVFTLSYDGTGASAKLRSVVSNRGFALLFEYGGGQFITKVCAINLAVTPMPAGNSCPSGVATANYAYNGDVQTSASMPNGGSWIFGQPSSSSFSLTRPGEVTPYLTNIYTLYPAEYPRDSLSIGLQSFADGTTYSYTWDFMTNTGEDGSYSSEAIGGSWTDNTNHTVEVRYGYYTKQAWNTYYDPTLFATPGPVMVRDQLNRVTTATYCGMTATTGYCAALQIPPLQVTTDPEGNSESYQYASFRNIYQTTKLAKPGSSLGNLTETRNYPNFGVPAVVRSKPISITDPRGNVTEMAYDPAHGGIAYEAGPADANGVRPVKWRSYVQRSAWVANGGGGFVSTSSPIWLLSSESNCRTTATDLNTGACAGGTGDQVVTAYDYGPNTGAVGNNLLLRGVAVTADGQTRRTCYGYDPQGNRIWETKPRAGLAACY